MTGWTAGDDPGDSEPDAPVRTTPRTAARTAARGYFDNFLLFALLNLLVVLGTLAVAAAYTVFAPALLLAPLVALPGSVLMRAATDVARGGTPSVADARQEVLRRAGRKLALASIQLAIVVAGVLNLVLASVIGGVGGVVAAGIGAYGLLVSTAYAVVLWPVVCDPRRDGPLRGQLKVALAVLVLRPLGVIVLVAITVASVTLIVLVIAPVIVLPALVALLCAAFVVPAADEVLPPAAADELSPRR